MAALGVAVVALLSPTAAASAEVSPQGVVGIDAPIVIEAADDSVDIDDPELIEELEALHESFEAGDDNAVGQAGDSAFLQASSGGAMSVAFDGTFTAPGNVQAVVNAAAAQWDAALATNPSGPINIAVIWKDLGSTSLLGSAGPNGLYRSGSLPTDDYYPAPLANTLLGTDINGAGSAEVVVNLNSTANWYINTSGAPGGKIDLYSVVLHEIGHGLGFLGSASELNPGASAGNPTLDSPPFVFDRLVTYSGVPLLNDGNPNSRLASNNLRVLLSDSLDAKLYAPPSWAEGSSFSHLDEAANPAGSAGALMTPSFGPNQIERNLDAVVLGIMAGIGWPMAVPPIRPTITGASAGSDQVTVSWSLDLVGHGPTPDTIRIEAWRNGGPLDGVVTVGASSTSATVGSLLSGNSYLIRVVSVRDSVYGVPAETTLHVSGAPGGPKLVNLAGSGLVRTITWDPPEAGGASSYTIDRSTDGVSWTTVGSTTGLGIGVALTEGVHQFRVRAVNNFGSGPYTYSIPMGVAAGLIRPVPLDGQLSRLYQAVFLRHPDGAGFAHWQGQRAAGVGISQVSSAFVASAEFQTRYGSLNNDQFINLVYQNVLGRGPDPTGYAYWMGQMNSGVGKGAVMIGFSDSNEFVGRTATVGPQSPAQAEVYRLFVAAFIRFPDAAGNNYWVGVRNGGTSLESIAGTFIGSPEFAQRYGSLSDDRFVELIYRNVLGRAPDAAGSAYWRSRLAAGVSRASMLAAFSQSAEFVLATGTLR